MSDVNTSPNFPFFSASQKCANHARQSFFSFFPPHYPQETIKTIPEDIVIKIICEQTNTTPSELLGHSSNHTLTKKRMLLVDYLLKYSNKNITEISGLLKKTESTISTQYSRFRKNAENIFPKELFSRIQISLEYYNKF